MILIAGSMICSTSSADPAFLMVAWDRVRGNKGARTAGVDGQTAYSIEAGRWRRGVPRRAAGLVEGPQLPPVAGAGTDDPQAGRQDAPAGDRRPLPTGWSRRP